MHEHGVGLAGLDAGADDVREREHGDDAGEATGEATAAEQLQRVLFARVGGDDREANSAGAAHDAAPISAISTTLGARTQVSGAPT